jgi:hypothetical protein
MTMRDWDSLKRAMSARGPGISVFGSKVSAQAGFGEVDGEAAFGAVVGAADEALADEVAAGVLD